MKFRWWTWLSASLGLFVGQRLNAVGEGIAQELERSYASSSDGIGSAERKRWRSPMRFLRLSRKNK